MERRLDEVNITVNKNAIPNESQKPFVTSGIRVGTPAATTRGFKEADMEVIASIMWRTATDFEGKQDELRDQVAQLTGRSIPVRISETEYARPETAACRKMASAGRPFLLTNSLGVVYL